LVHQLEHPEKAVKMQKKRKEITKIKGLEKTQTQSSLAFTTGDYYDEIISRITKQQMSNLQELVGSDILLSDSFRASETEELGNLTLRRKVYEG